MSMNVQSTLGYGNYQSAYQARETKEAPKSQSTEAATKENFVSQGEKRLSKSAQKMLQKLRGSRSDMDFMVADFDKGDNAKEILSHSNKEFTVIFSSEELEKMAADEDYYAEKMRGVGGALRMSEEINAQFGFERAFGKNGNAANSVSMTKFGISFNQDGSVTLFAELEKSMLRQKEQIEKLQDKKEDTKKVTLQAKTQEELVEKIKNMKWDLARNEAKTVGGKVDYSI